MDYHSAESLGDDQIQRLCDDLVKPVVKNTFLEFVEQQPRVGRCRAFTDGAMATYDNKPSVPSSDRHAESAEDEENRSPRLQNPCIDSYTMVFRPGPILEEVGGQNEQLQERRDFGNAPEAVSRKLNIASVASDSDCHAVPAPKPPLSSPEPSAPPAKALPPRPPGNNAPRKTLGLDATIPPGAASSASAQQPVRQQPGQPVDWATMMQCLMAMQAHGITPDKMPALAAQQLAMAASTSSAASAQKGPVSAAMPQKLSQQKRIRNRAVTGEMKQQQQDGQPSDNSKNVLDIWAHVAPLLGAAASRQQAHAHRQETACPPATRTQPTKSAQEFNKRHGGAKASNDGAQQAPRQAQAEGADAAEFAGPMTTVMLRNLPNRYTRDNLIQMLNNEGFAGKYTFVYVPIDFKTHIGLGYAFVDLESPEQAHRLREHFEGFHNWMVPCDKICAVGWSHPQQQGLQAHIDRYRNSPVMHPVVDDSWKPVIFNKGVQVPFPPPTRRLRAPTIKSPGNAAARC